MSDTPDGAGSPEAPAPRGGAEAESPERPDPGEPAGDLADRTQEDTAEAGAAAPGVEAAGATRRTRRPLLAAVAGAVVVALVAGGVTAGWMRGWWGDSAAPAPSGTPTPGGAETASPFAGTPAEHFAEGEAGIVLPAAEPVGDFTAEEVAEALEQVRQALIAARLDETMLVDHNPEKFLSLLAPDQRAALRVALEDGEFGPFPTRFVGVTYELVEPRVHGEATFRSRAVQRGDELIEVTTRFVWVYAAASTRHEGATSLAVIRDELLWQVRGEPWLEPSQGLWLHTVKSEAWGLSCSGAPGMLYPTGLAATDLQRHSDTQLGIDWPTDRFADC